MRKVAKRLATIAHSHSFIAWHKVKPVAADLDTERRAILGTVVPHDPKAALDLLWCFAAGAQSVFARSDDGSGLLDAMNARVLPITGGV